MFAAFAALGLLGLLPGLVNKRGTMLPDIDHPTTALPAADLPHVVPLRSLLSESLSNSRRQHRACKNPWQIPLGIASDGNRISFDLITDGPHLLVAGTTGSGKSVVLRSLIIALASQLSPEQLTIALVDYKGGASFGDCPALPHVVGQVTDLDSGLAERALAGLRIELTRRKRVLQQFGVSDIGELATGTLPRLVVVFDEFRALTEELPDAISQLFQIAAQGRSLGIHLVLATQRAAGAVSPELRANVSARLALRVVDVADSIDLVDSPLAAGLPAVPGRAVLHLGSEPPQVLQCAWADAAPVPMVYRPDVPLAVQTPPMLPLVTQIVDRYSAEKYPKAAPLWLPLLPTDLDLAMLLDWYQRSCVPRSARPQDDEKETARPQDDEKETARRSGRLSSSDIVGATVETGQSTGHIPLGIGDFVEERAQRVVAWQPMLGPLGVVGGQTVARTSALEAIGLAAAELSYRVHWLGRLDATSPLANHPNFSCSIPTTAPEQATNLIYQIIELGNSALASYSSVNPPTSSTDPHPPTSFCGPQGTQNLQHHRALPILILIENAERWRYVPRFFDLVTEVQGLCAIAIASNSASLNGFSELVTAKLITLSPDANENLLLGSPKKFASLGTTPGRAVWQAPPSSSQGSSPILCQLPAAKSQ